MPQMAPSLWLPLFININVTIISLLIILHFRYCPANRPSPQTLTSIAINFPW